MNITIEKTTRSSAAEIDAIKSLEVNDVLIFQMNNGETVAARAVEERIDHKMVIYFIDCLWDGESVNDDDTNRGGWMGSDLRKKLNSEILDRFPADLRVKMLPTETGDLLRLATETEIFGFNEYGRPEEFEESLTQWPCMAIRRNRIGFQGYDSDAWGWTWLMNSVGKVFFADVRSRGLSYYDSASDVHGVRPLFLIDLS